MYIQEFGPPRFLLSEWTDINVARKFRFIGKVNPYYQSIRTKLLRQPCDRFAKAVLKPEATGRTKSEGLLSRTSANVIRMSVERR
jgi:hypothetical protein